MSTDAAQAPAVPATLTDEQIMSALASITREVPVRLPPGWKKFARAIEAAVLAAAPQPAPVAQPDAAIAAVAAERERWRTLIAGAHAYNGDCPDSSDWNRRDSECPACAALGDWLA